MPQWTTTSPLSQAGHGWPTRHLSIDVYVRMIIGLFKTQSIKVPRPWKSVGQIALDTLKRIDKV
ncbi:hypothetical protein [Tateyamaria pelophila]|uniref:hypothetical protein n=1 Tax=Tateyamaria pelophila TaxID=328415 RepID=UPI001CBB5C8A|nr:hypothetical protein [Tateyamaria pelophila]